ncbi:group II intron maturase-specific domain-containing protein [Tepidibacillus marianensis]|uniref:group II intron maturase-specific domain-containing protein n=1 Tax=Tepidibacillus marianensis TaxID=3131995 RepID=UPI0030D5ADE9
MKRLKDKIKDITNRNVSRSMESRMKSLNQLITGWVNYFRIAAMKGKLKEIDGWTRRRLRACVWKQWKRIRTRYRNLLKFKLPDGKAWEYANTRKGYWRISNSPILSKTLTNQYWINQALKVFLYSIKLLVCLNEPPCTERYARWCERTQNKIIIQLLLDYSEKEEFPFS